jgi:hypothetical protein
MENIDLGKSANQIWKESGSNLNFKTWLQREKDKGRFLPNKQLIEFNSFEGDKNLSARELINETLNETKIKPEIKKSTFGLNKYIITVSILLVLGGVAYKIYQKNNK